MYPYKIFGDFDLYTICITLGAAACLVVFRLLVDRLRLSARLTNLTLAAGVAGMAAGLETSTTVNVGRGPIEHNFSGVIRVEGVTSEGEFVASTDLLIDQLVDVLRREARFA